MRSSRSSILVAAAMSLASFAPSAQPVAQRSSGVRPLRTSNERPYISPDEVEKARGLYTSPNGGRNRKGHTVNADKRRNKARA